MKDMTQKVRGWFSDDDTKHWESLSTETDGTREEKLYEVFHEVSTLEPAQGEERLQRLIKKEYSLPDDQLQGFTRSRLMALLRLDPDAAAKAAAAYEAAMARMPGEVAFKYASMMQMASRDLPIEDMIKLRTLLPKEFGENPREESVATPGPDEPQAPFPGRRWADSGSEASKT